ncbi:MAG: TlpA disulfide reductase family protein [Acidobacteriota bacterium]|nr:TlpA disulfide reductase family protein [Acidobacteriota bacterium]
MSRSIRLALAAAVVTAALGTSTSAQTPSPAGLWDAAVVVGGLEIPFRFEIAANGSAVSASFFNGDEKVTSTGGKFEHGLLLLNFDHYATSVEAAFVNGRLVGAYNRATGFYPFYAKRFEPSPAFPNEVPQIDGLWQIGGVRSNKGEAAWRLIVRQSGAEVTAAILRVDGDTGALAGTFRDGKFIVSHFSGARPLVLELTPTKDGALEIVRNRQEKMVAVRAAEAKLKDVPEPTDPSRHSSVKDPTEPFKFSFPDMNGKIVTNADPRFHGKVLIVSISGSWCPNCHDEAPFLAELYRKYQSKGLEIVALSFEEAKQLPELKRLKAFNKRYGVEYPVLLAGEQADLAEKVPQIHNLNSFPTTIFLGKDGLVRGVHAGFAGAASGVFHSDAKTEITATIERLLAESATTRAR